MTNGRGQDGLRHDENESVNQNTDGRAPGVPATSRTDQTDRTGPTGPVYGTAGPRGAAPVPPAPPPGYAAPGYQQGPVGNDSEPTQYTPIIPGQVLDEMPDPAGQESWLIYGEQGFGPTEQRTTGEAPVPQYGPAFGHQQAPSPQYGKSGRYGSGSGGTASAPPSGHSSWGAQGQSSPPPSQMPLSQPPSDRPLSPKETNQWAAGAHAGGLLAWIPVVPLIPAAAIYAVYKDRSPYIKEQALEALNFQICVLIAFVAAGILDALPILDNFTVLVWALSAIFGGVGAVTALRGRQFRYPFTRRFLT